MTPLHLATRAYGALTAAYGLYALARPQHLARQLGIEPQTATRLGRALGVRDLACGLAIVLASRPDAVRTALVARTTFDGLDVVGFGLLAPKPDGRRNAAGVATVWGAVGVALLVAHGRVPASGDVPTRGDAAPTTASVGDAS